MILTGVARVIGLGMITVMLAGCTLYWQKPGADMAAFSADHQECMKISGTPVTQEQLYVNLDIYRACLRARGWQRESASSTAPPPGHFRGQENEGPVALGSLPPQPSSPAEPRP